LWDALFKPLAFGFTRHTAALKDVAENIRKIEAEAVQAGRTGLLPAGGNAAKPAECQDAIGLALSGGGIRSAIFSLGVAQVFAEKGFLKEVDFLSTVSGGGYSGCFLTQRLGNGELQSDVAAPNGPDPGPVRYLRQHAKFLSPYNLKEKWSMVTATLAGMLLNWTAPLLVIPLLALVAKWFAVHCPIPWLLVLLGCGVLCVAATVAYGLGFFAFLYASFFATHLFRRRSSGDRWHRSLASGPFWRRLFDDLCHQRSAELLEQDEGLEAIWKKGSQTSHDGRRN